jgi:hypothetical protein
MPNLETKTGLQDNKLRELLSFLIKQSGMSREQIAERMTDFLGKSILISRRMLDDWTSECHKSARFPLFFVEAFCYAIDNDRLQRWAAGAELLKKIEFTERQLDLKERRAELVKANSQHDGKGKRPRKS